MLMLKDVGQNHAEVGCEWGDGSKQLAGACEKGGAGIGASVPELERTSKSLERRPKAPWWGQGRSCRPSPHHGAACSRNRCKSPCV